MKCKADTSDFWRKILTTGSKNVSNGAEVVEPLFTWLTNALGEPENVMEPDKGRK